MRARLASLILLACVCALVTRAKADSLQPAVDAYMAEVTRIVAGALMPELAKHRDLANVTKKFSFDIDPSGHPSKIKATSAPPTKSLDRLVTRIVRALKFPPIPKNILQKYDSLHFETEMGPPTRKA